MQTRRMLIAALVVAVSGAMAQYSHADPCGMVPPIYAGQEVPLARLGVQQTYVFYQDGVETFVIRPGFTGKVDEFGMLIPFPSVPAIRKVPDHIFQHIAAAVDPPEVVVDLRPGYFSKNFRGQPGAKSEQNGKILQYKENVTVVKKEAIGMYEVVVLEAGSAAALKRWMVDHGYKYPTGMDKACEDYVDAGWCFVAVKTQVGQKAGVDPQPGQRQVSSKLPTGSTFDGSVQGMGFRFRVDKLVVPMRLSTFNAGDLRNVVYLLTSEPQRIRSIPEEYVVRQISGAQLIKNVSQPLPLRIIGGSEADIPDYQRRTLPQRRNPIPKNGAARELFASDLLAIKNEKLSLPHEEQEKELLRIGERFGLRGADIDRLNTESLAAAREKTVKDSLKQLKGMTLTVVDGDFPREVLRDTNLTFASYKMPGKRNRRQSYDAKLKGPGQKREGVLKVGALRPLSPKQAVATKANGSSNALARLALILSVLAAGLVGLVLAIRFRRMRRATFAALFLLIAGLALAPFLAVGQDKAASAPASAEDTPSSYYEKTLREKNIEPTAKGLNEYFRNLHPSEAQRTRAAQLIKQLGAIDSFAEREEATAKLLVMPVLPTAALVKASQGGDPEIRWRARRILELGGPESERVLYSAFKTIEQRKLAGVTDELIRALPLCDKPHLRYAAREALKAAAQKSDAPSLRRALASENAEIRVAAAAGRAPALGEDSVADLTALFEDPAERVRLAAAQAATNAGDRKCLDVFLRLLSSDDKQLRGSASVALRQLSGKSFDFAAYGDPEKRKAAVANWKAWIEGDGKTAKLNVPLRTFGSGVSYLSGNTLIAFGHQNKVVEFDPTGKEVWSFSVTNVWSAEKLASGNVLIVSYGQNRVLEVNANGKVIWHRDGGNPINAKQLLNGNVLISEHTGGRIVEVDQDKKIIWKYALPGNPTDAHRLTNGNTLVASNGANVREVTPNGKVVWEYPATQSYGCQPLPNGNVLITELSGRIYEVTRDKKKIWEFTESNACDAFRLPNGNTLITGNNRVIEVTPDKKIVWTKTGLSYGSARR